MSRPHAARSLRSPWFNAEVQASLRCDRCLGLIARTRRSSCSPRGVSLSSAGKSDISCVLGSIGKTGATACGGELEVPFKSVVAKIPIAFREATGDDFAHLFPGSGADGLTSEQPELAWHYELLKARFPTCLVAVDQRTGAPCHVQWLTGAEHNARLPELGCFPMLRSDEALIENVYTPPSHRRLGIMSAAMSMVAERAADFGARHVITFVDRDNVPSLKGCGRAGFTPYLVRRRTQLAFRLIRRCAFESLPEDHEASYPC